MSHPPKLFNMAEFIQGETLISDAPLPKQQLGEALGVSRPSIQKYDKVAFWTIKPYREEYPLLSREETLKRKCSRDTTPPLTPYQIYMVSMIRALFKRLKNERAVKSYIRSNAYLFTCSNLQY